MSIPAHSLSFPPVLKGICSLSHQLDQMGNRKERGQHKLSMVKHQKKKKMEPDSLLQRCKTCLLKKTEHNWKKFEKT